MYSTLLSVAAGLLSMTGTGVEGRMIRRYATRQTNATVCNGHAELCDRPYGNVTFFGSHDSFAFSSDPLALAADQRVDVPTQLSLGVRFLQAQSHIDGGTLKFCHTSCDLFDGGSVQDYLTNVKTFLDNNPNEVLTLLFTNPDGASLTDLWQPAFDGAGVTPFVYTPDPASLPLKRSDWPTLGDMISSGKRVVAFLDSGANVTQVPFLLPEFDMLWEPPFSVTDPTFPCSVNRISGPLSPQDHLNMLNHNLNIAVFGDQSILVSDPGDANTTNGVDSIMANANGCAPLAGNVFPNFVMLDFVNIGQGQQAVDIMNGFASS